MDVLRRMRRRTALRVGPEPAGGSCQQPQAERATSVPAGREAATSQPRTWTWTRLAFLTRKRPAPRAGTERGEAASALRRRCPKFCLGRRDPVHERSQATQLWVCFCFKASPQESSPVAQRETSPSLHPGDLPASPGQEMGGPCPSTSSSACSRGESGCFLGGPWSTEAECSSTTAAAGVTLCPSLPDADDLSDLSENWPWRRRRRRNQPRRRRRRRRRNQPRRRVRRNQPQGRSRNQPQRRIMRRTQPQSRRRIMMRTQPQRRRDPPV
ncbi:uncharacterized protein LOC120374892 [Mauremys reevesii]|uniref:uncharacterized protein LOC120374892 n=1 Tax=Mauremys reevesii TaxID=260615 RepID=UPI001940084C|nr:uncharacterized protein LOC120374892 [Mauremys reevesii]